MNLDELRSVQEAERRKSNLQTLRDSFYEEAGKYVADLKAERARVAERADDPFSNPEVGRLTDEIETAEEVVEAIYERRMGKLLDEASLAAAGMGTDEEGLTAEERELFHAVVGRIEANKASVLETIAGNVGDEGGDSGGGDGTAGPAPDAGGEPAPDRRERSRPAGDEGDGRDASAPETRDSRAPGGEDGSTGGRRAVEPGSPPPDGGAPDAADGGISEAADDGVPAAGAMGTDSDDAGGSDEPPEPPSPDEFADGSTENPGSPRPGTGKSGSTGPDRTGADEAASGGSDAVGPTLEEIDDRVTVMITDDVGSIYGVDDREYDLERESVVRLPEQNAEPLLDSGAAERLD